MKKTILFVAGSIETKPAVELANRMGLHTVVSDGNPNASSFGVSADQIVASTYDVAETVQKARQYHNQIRPIDGVICVASDVPLTVAAVAADLKLPGIPVTSAKLAMDKLAMKEQFQQDAIPIPWFKEVTSVDMLTSLVKTADYPMILKPVDSRGARGVMRLIDGLNLEYAFAYAKKISPTGRVMVEEYLDGPQVSTESIVIDGVAHTPGFADRNYSLLEKYAPFVIEDGGDLPSILPEEIQHSVRQLLTHAARSMGIQNGVVKGDIVIHKGEAFVIELAARLSGGYLSTHEIPLSTGVDFVGAAIRMALGEKVAADELQPKYSRYICQRHIFSKPGVVASINGYDAVAARDGIEFCQMKVAPGDKIGKMESHLARSGLVISRGKSREDAIKRAQQAVDDIVVEIV